MICLFPLALCSWLLFLKGDSNLTSPLLDYKEKGHCVDFMVLRILIVL